MIIDDFKRSMAIEKIHSALRLTRKNDGFSFLSYSHGLIDGLRVSGMLNALEADRLSDLALNAHQYARRDTQ